MAGMVPIPLGELLEALSVTTNPNSEIRKRIYADESVDIQLRRLSIIFAKNVIQRKGPGPHMEAAKSILSAMIANGSIQRLPFKEQIGVVVSKIAYSQFPDKWTGIREALISLLQSTQLTPLDQISSANDSQAFDSVPCAAYLIKKILQQRVRRMMTGRQLILDLCNAVLPPLMALWTQSAQQLEQILPLCASATGPLPAQQAGVVQYVLTQHRFLGGAVLVALKIVSGTKPHMQPAVCAAAHQAVSYAILSVRLFMCSSVRGASRGLLRRFALGCVRTYFKWLADIAKPSALLFAAAADGTAAADASGGFASVLELCWSFLTACKSLWAQVDSGDAEEDESMPDAVAKHALTLLEHVLQKSYVYSPPSPTTPVGSDLGERGLMLCTAASQQLSSFFAQKGGDLSSLSHLLAEVCLSSNKQDLETLLNDPNEQLARPECRIEGKLVIDTVSAGIFAQPVARALEQRLSSSFSAQSNSLESLREQELVLSWAAAAKRAFKEAGVPFSARVGLLVNILTSHSNVLLHARAGDLAKAWYDAETTPEAFSAALEVLVRVLDSNHALCQQTAVEHLKSLYVKDPEHEAWAINGQRIAERALLFAATLKHGHWGPLELASCMIVNETSSVPSVESVKSLLRTWQHLQATLKAIRTAADAEKNGNASAMVEMFGSSGAPSAVSTVAAQCALVDTLAGILSKSQDQDLVNKARVASLIKGGKLSAADVAAGAASVGLPVEALQTVGLIAADCVQSYLMDPLEQHIAKLKQQAAQGKAVTQDDIDEFDPSHDTEVTDLIASAIALVSATLRSAVLDADVMVDPSAAAVSIPGDQRGNLMVWAARTLIVQGAQKEGLIWTVESHVLDMAAEVVAAAVSVANKKALANVNANPAFTQHFSGNGDADSALRAVLASGCLPMLDSSAFLTALGGQEVLSGVIELARRGLEDSKSQMIDRGRQILTMLVPLMADATANANVLPADCMQQLERLVSSFAVKFIQRPLDKAPGGSAAALAELVTAWCVHAPSNVLAFAVSHGHTAGEFAASLVTGTQHPMISSTAALSVAACSLLEAAVQRDGAAVASNPTFQKSVAEAVTSLGQASPVVDAAASDLQFLLGKASSKRRSAFTQRDELANRPVSIRLRAVVNATSAVSRSAAALAATQQAGAVAQVVMGDAWVFSRALTVANAVTTAQRLVGATLPQAAVEQLLHGNVLPADTTAILRSGNDLPSVLAALNAEVQKKAHGLMNMN